MFDWVPQSMKEVLSLVADVAGVLGCIVSAYLFFTRESLRKTLKVRHGLLPDGLRKLRALEVQFRKAIGDDDAEQIKRNARGSHDHLKRMQADKLIQVEAEELDLLARVSRGTSQEWSNALHTIGSCLDRIEQAQEDDRWKQ